MTIVNLITIQDKEMEISSMTQEEKINLSKELNEIALASIGYEEKKEKG